MKNAPRLSIVVVCLLLTRAAHGAECKQVGDRWVLENDKVHAEIAPALGGRVVSFVDKRFPQSLVRDPKGEGLFIDHEAGDPWPGALWSAPYDCKPVAAPAGEVALECTVTYRDNKFPKSSGVVIHKTYRLRDGEAGLRVMHQLENPTSKDKVFALWVQNVLELGKNAKKNVDLWPYATGVMRYRTIPKQQEVSSEEHFPDWPLGFGWNPHPDSTAPWNGKIDPSTGQAVIFMQDWDFLKMHYFASPAFTCEWFMERVSLAPGGKWRTESALLCRVLPTSLVAFNDQAWAAAKLNKDETAIDMEIGSEKPDAVFELEGTLRQAQTGKIAPVKLTALKPGKFTVPLPAGIMPPIGFSAMLKGAGPDLVIAEFLGGAKYPENVSYLGGPPMWRARPREKNPQFPKPAEIKLAADADKRVWILHGPFALDMRIKESLEAAGFTVKEGFEETGFGAGIGGGPTSYEDLLSCGTILCNNADLSLLTSFQRFALKDYFAAGGRLVMLGGTTTRAGNWDTSPLCRLAPLKPSLLAPRDMGGAAGPRQEWAALLPESTYAQTWKPEAGEILLGLDGEMLAARMPVGRGEIVAMGLSGMGQVQPADYFSSERWRKLLLELVRRTR